MSRASTKKHDSQMIDGLLIPGPFNPENVRSAINYKPRPDDLFIVTYPKCGTTWTQQIVALILRHGEPMSVTDTNEQYFSASPFLEARGAQAAETMQRPGAIKFHLPFHLAPWSEKAKYIYVARNPKDCCVSYFHHERGHGRDFTFDEYFEIFISGKASFGDYFDHLLGWYEHRSDPNVLFLTYEEMKENIESAILKMASFIDDEKYAKPLRSDPQKLNNVIQFSTFKHMKEITKKVDELSETTEEDDRNSELPNITEHLDKNRHLSEKKKHRLSNNVRKGIIGDWINYFSEEQSQRMNDKFSERTKGTDIEHFWKGYL